MPSLKPAGSPQKAALSKLIRRELRENHGRHIFVYNHLQTNQVVYSLTRALNNANALSQITFVGKKTKPAKLRKDVWQPLAIITFPHAAQGLVAYRQLREFHKLHEHNWVREDGRYHQLPEGEQKFLARSGNLPTKKQRARIIMDQKANAVADIAAVLKIHEREAGTRQPRLGFEWDGAPNQKQSWVLNGGGVKVVKRMVWLATELKKQETLADKQLRERFEGELDDLRQLYGWLSRGLGKKKRKELNEQFKSNKLRVPQKELSELTKRLAPIKGWPVKAEEEMPVKGKMGIPVLAKTRDFFLDKFGWKTPEEQPAKTTETIKTTSEPKPITEKQLLERAPLKLPIKVRRGFTFQGVYKIMWKHIADSAFAAEWPSRVEHDEMARDPRYRHTPQKPVEMAPTDEYMKLQNKQHQKLQAQWNERQQARLAV